MLKRIKSFFLIPACLLLIAAPGCKKGTFDINNTNPNVPSNVDPKLVLSGSLAGSAAVALRGNGDFMNYYMGYWAVSGDYIPNAQTLTYNLTTDFFNGNWDDAYTLLANYKLIEKSATGPKDVYYKALSKIMQAYHYQRLVDIYNNIPYSESVKGSGNFNPKYDDAKSVYKDLVNQLDSALQLIKGAGVDANAPANYDILFGRGTKTSDWATKAAPKWSRFANTLRLKILMRLTQTSDGPAFITAKLAGAKTSDFLGAGEDASVNPGYSNSAANQQSPIWGDVGKNTGGTPYGNNQYYRANSYAVNFYLNNNDPRASYFYDLNSSGKVRGRAFGSTALEHNSDISAIGPGILKSPTMDAVILPAFESLFLQAEAANRGYITADASSLYTSAVTESFRLLGVPDYANAASNYIGQSNDNVNYKTSASPLTTLITQKWAALNVFDPLESWSDWRRLGIPSDLPVSIYPGTTASHIPYRLPYPTSEFNYNAANANSQGTINPITSKIFWMP